MNCLIENEGKKTEKKKRKKTLVFTNELPNWKQIHTGKKTEKKRKKNILNFSIHKWICLIENEY